MRALECFAAGGTVLVAGAGDGPVLLATPAETIAAARLEALHQLGRGMVLLALEEPIADQLRLSSSGPSESMVDLPFTTTIDARKGDDGGWSLRDRARTMRIAADPATGPEDLRIPGHVQPVRIPPSNVLDGPSEGPAAAVELARRGCLRPAAVVGVVVDRAGRPLSLSDARSDRELARLPTLEVESIRAVMRADHAAGQAVSCRLPTREAGFTAVAHASAHGDATVALVHGEPAALPETLVHLHAACLLGDVFGSRVCTCRPELDRALAEIVSDGAGVVVYSKPAVTPVEFTCGRDRPVDAAVAAGLLRRVGVRRVRLPRPDFALCRELRRLGIEVAPER